MSRAAIWASGNARVRAAASSMASGSPSSRAQMSAMTVVPSSSASSIAAPAAWARVEEQPDGVVGGQRRHRPDGLAADPQPLAARGEEAQARAAPQQVLGDLGGGGDDVLAVVEHEQQVLVADHLGEPVRVRQVEGRGDRRGNAGRITDRGQLDQAARRSSDPRPRPGRPRAPAGSCPRPRGRRA